MRGLATRPTAVPVAVTISRYQTGADDWSAPVDAQIVWDRTQPEETPVRYAPSGTALYKGHADHRPAALRHQDGDRFVIEPSGTPATVQYVLPGQPQRTEARLKPTSPGPRM